MKRRIALLSALLLFLCLALRSQAAAEGAWRGLAVCASALAPSLFPFFVLSNLLSSLGLADLLSGLAGGAMERLFRVSGSGAQAFFLGITGGYPLGASVVARLRRDGQIGRKEAEHLLAFCNNSGPAFILGAVGGVFRSPPAGLLLCGTHVLAAVTVGILLRPGQAPAPAPRRAAESPPLSLGEALPAAAAAALTGTLTVCGYVVLFSALMALIPGLAALDGLTRALLSGCLELGSGISALAGLTPAPRSLAAAAFLMGWGGLSVHCQTLSAVAGTDIGCARHLAGRALCGVLAGLFTYAGALLLF
ncbi:MAG: sporulation protein [Oscillospiraceae bacterium]|nr:sporulation protein [Oscillospiraceae bacterium]